MWIVAAVFSAFFAGVTAVLSKCGLKNVDSDAATAVRTTVVAVFSWLVVWWTGSLDAVAKIDGRSLLFLILSGLATGASWLCYFKALSLGEMSRVAAVDKSSVVVSVLLAMAIFPEERNALPIKLVCLVFVAAGTFLMADIRRGEEKKKFGWLFFALLSALFAAATSVLAKIGMDDVPSSVATAIRTCVVLVAAWLFVLGRGKTGEIKKIKGREALFLVLSGAATGIGWLCYYYAVQNGSVGVVVPIDKMSIWVTVIFSCVVLKEKPSARSWAGLVLLTAGTVAMAVWT